MNRRELEQAIRDEVAEWPGVAVEFVEGGKHPKAKLTYAPEGEDPLMLSRPFPGTPSDSRFGLHKCLGDMRRIMRQLGAARAKPEPSEEEVERRYSKPNDGAEKRPHPIKGEPAPVKADMVDKFVSAAAGMPTGADIINQANAILAKRANDVADEPDAVVKMLHVLLACGLEARVEGEVTLAAVIGAAAGMIEDGVYFGLPAEVYHAVPRLSASGLQRLCVSPATFWRGSWMDPDRPELDEEETKAQQLGKAYHVARLEPERFHASYVREIDKADFPAKGLLTSDAAVKAELKNLGQTQTIGNESIAERAERLVDAGYEGTILPLEKARWEDTVNGRVSLPAKYFDQIVTDMQRIRANDEIADLLSGGEAEVSIFWTDRHGLKMKARVDYLTPGWWDDFKTFDNSRGKELEQALADAVRYNRYHVQAVTYRDAVEAIRLGGLQVRGNATDAQRALVAAIQIRPDELACWYVFQEKGGVPNLLAMDFPFYTVPLNTKLGHAGASEEAIARVEAAARIKSGVHIRAIQDIDKAKRDFVLYAEVYEPGQPWSPIEAVRRFSDDHFSRYWLEGMQA